jgi:hypothetical protein
MSGGLMISPPSNQFFGTAHLLPASPPQPTRSSTLYGIVLDRDWSGRTFKIPDCPAKDTVSSLKGWYIRNVCPSTQPANLQIVEQHTNTLISDNTPFWQLAEGESWFEVTVVHVDSSNSSNNNAPTASLDEPITLYVQHESTAIGTTVNIPRSSTLIQMKVIAFSQMGLGDAAAAINPRVGVKFNHQVLDNEATLYACSLSTGDRVVIFEGRTPPPSVMGSQSSSPTEGHHSLMGGIWAQNDSPEVEDLTLPKALLHDQVCEPCHVKPPKSSNSNINNNARARRAEADLEKMKSSYRTKMCRVGPTNCKYGHNCWFAHCAEELRRPSDPLPAHCPGVSKLAQYAKRQDNN